MIYNHNVKLYEYSSAGHFNDPDMLEVGNGKLSYNQNVSHFSLWCMMNAPLILGNDLRTMPENVNAIVTNQNMIAINQDPLCKQAKRVKRGTVDVLAKPLANGSTAICFFNKSSHSASVGYHLNRLCDDKYVSMKKANAYALVEQWNGTKHSVADKIKVKLKKHESKVYIINAE